MMTKVQRVSSQKPRQLALRQIENVLTQPSISSTMRSRQDSSLFAIARRWTWSDAILAAVSAWVAYFVTVGIYSVYFHPLSGGPGPKVSATRRSRTSAQSAHYSFTRDQKILINLLDLDVYQCKE
jgi:hypothetical protein